MSANLWLRYLFCQAYLDAAAKLGVPRNMDVNGERQEGVTFYQLTQCVARLGCDGLYPAKLGKKKLDD